MKKVIISSLLTASILSLNCSFVAMAGGGPGDGESSSNNKTESSMSLARRMLRGVGTGFGHLTTGFGAFSALNEAAFFLQQADRINESFVKPAVGRIKRAYNGRYNGFRPLDEALARLDEEFLKIKGQEQAKSEIREYIYNFLRNLENGGPKGKQILYLVGPSGVGKSMITEAIARAILVSKDSSFYQLKSSDLDISNVRNGERESVKSQIFGLTSTWGNRDFSTPAQPRPRTADFLATHSSGIVNFDEYDKYYDQSLDETLRGFAIDKKFSHNSFQIECPDVLIIVTSNESLDSVSNAAKKAAEEEKERLKKEFKSTSSSSLDEVNDEGESKKEPSEDKPSAAKPDSAASDIDGTTHRVHDGSCLNRFKVIGFNKLEDEDYKEIARDLFTICAKLEENKFGIKLEASEETIECLAREAIESFKGAHEMTEIISGRISSLMYKYRDELHERPNNRDRIPDFEIRKHYIADIESGKLQETNKQDIIFNNPDKFEAPHVFINGVGETWQQDNHEMQKLPDGTCVFTFEGVDLVKNKCSLAFNNQGDKKNIQARFPDSINRNPVDYQKAVDSLEAAIGLNEVNMAVEREEGSSFFGTFKKWVTCCNDEDELE